MEDPMPRRRRRVRPPDEFTAASSFPTRAVEDDARGGGAWRCGPLLVAEHDAVLPGRCVRCNRPVASPPVRCRLFIGPARWWAPRAALHVLRRTLAPASIPLRSCVHAHFCEIHLGRQRAALRVAGLLWATGAVMIALAFLRHGLDAVAGVIAIVAGLAVWLLSPGALTAVRIDDEHAWIEGVDRAFLAELPARAGDFSLN